MDVEALLITLVIGGLAGWLAGLIMKGGSLGLVGNIIVGILGAVIGGFIFKTVGISLGSDFAGSIVTATVGAVVLLFGVGLIKK